MLQEVLTIQLAANELSSLLEEVYLLRSPANSKRLFDAIEWSEKQLSQLRSQIIH